MALELWRPALLCFFSTWGGRDEDEDGEKTNNTENLLLVQQLLQLWLAAFHRDGMHRKSSSLALHLRECPWTPKPITIFFAFALPFLPSLMMAFAAATAAMEPGLTSNTITITTQLCLLLWGVQPPGTSALILCHAISSSCASSSSSSGDVRHKELDFRSYAMLSRRLLPGVGSCLKLLLWVDFYFSRFYFNEWLSFFIYLFSF